MVIFKYNCEECGYGCMAEKVFVMHTVRCEAGLTESQEKTLIRGKQLKELEDIENE